MNYEELVKTMRDKAVEFDAALGKVKKTNDELIVRAERALQSITELLGTVRPPAEKKCTVCYTREVEMVLAPCGHTFCTSCARRAERTRCHSCRGNVISSMRVFI